MRDENLISRLVKRKIRQKIRKIVFEWGSKIVFARVQWYFNTFIIYSDIYMFIVVCEKTARPDIVFHHLRQPSYIVLGIAFVVQ